MTATGLKTVLLPVEHLASKIVMAVNDCGRQFA